MSPLAHFAAIAAVMLTLAAGAHAVATHNSVRGAAQPGPAAAPVPSPARVLFVGPSPSDDGTEYLMVMLIEPNTTVIGHISTVEAWQKFKMKNGQLDIEAMRKTMRAGLMNLLEDYRAAPN